MLKRDQLLRIVIDWRIFQIMFVEVGKEAEK